jgi:hypothetical protein
VLANVRNMKDNFLVEGMNMLDGGDQMWGKLRIPILSFGIQGQPTTGTT